jgi:hypothetical protein
MRIPTCCCPITRNARSTYVCTVNRDRNDPQPPLRDPRGRLKGFHREIASHRGISSKRNMFEHPRYSRAIDIDARYMSACALHFARCHVGRNRNDSLALQICRKVRRQLFSASQTAIYEKTQLPPDPIAHGPMLSMVSNNRHR